MCFSAVPVSSGSNYWSTTASTSGASPFLGVIGGGTNIGCQYRTKGTGVHSFQNSAGAASFVVSTTTSAVNTLQVSGTTGTTALPILATGTATNLDIRVQAKGTGGVALESNAGTPQFRASHTASAVNYLDVTGSTGSSAPIMTVTGTGTDVPINIRAKGNSSVNLQTGTATTFQATGSSSHVNYLSASSSAATNAVSLTATGTDSDIQINIIPKGAGVTRFVNGALQVPELSATPTATPAAGTQFIYIKSSDGKLYRKNSAGTETLIGG
jgi:hypothetical protein